MKKQVLLFIAAALSSPAAFSQTDAPAFPGAEGHGRYVTGGRGGEVRVVTNLNDSGEGSFREAVKGSTKKIVVFNVGGVIPLESDLSIGANTTIAGQTAPYPGITLRYKTIRLSDNIIMRFIRGRRGEERVIEDDEYDGGDAIWDRHMTGIIIDHCSFSWSTDEVASFYDNNNFTMQWCTAAESLNDAGHSKGEHGYGGIWGGKLASFHHNLIAHVANRSPRFNGARYGWEGYKDNILYNEYNWANTVQAENVDFRNCVVYNSAGDCYGGPGGGQINIVDNYYKGGPATSNSKARRITTVTVSTQGNSDKNHPEFYDMTSRYYINGNINEQNDGKLYTGDNWAKEHITYDDGTIDINGDGDHWSKDVNLYYGNDVPRETYNGASYIRIRMDEPTATGEITTHDAETAFEKVLAYCGASLHRDVIDTRYMEEAKTGTAKYIGSKTDNPRPGLIDIVADAKDSYTEKNFPTGEHPADFDTDGDGMPDEWEKDNGLDPNDPNDASETTVDKEKGWYTNIEVYANSLVEHIVKGQNADGESNYTEYYPKCVSTGIENVNAGTSEIEKIEYYTIGGVKLNEPAKGISIRKITFTNGKTVTDKVIK